MTLDSSTLRKVADWCDAEVKKTEAPKPHGLYEEAERGELEQFYFGYSGATQVMRKLADRIDRHGSLDRVEGDRPLGYDPEDDDE